MNTLFITAVNDELWQSYAERTIKTWQHLPRIYWELPRPPAHDLWQQWREFHKQRYPEPDFKHTWSRFSHKVEAQLTALCDRQIRADYQYLVWLDADVAQTERYTEQWLEQQMPQKGDMITYLGRGDSYHPETGWIAYDLQHPDLDRFCIHLRGEYLGDRLWRLPEWHDAYVWDHVCREQKIPRRNLIPPPHHKGEAFARSTLHPHFRHYKGDRKRQI